MQIKFVCVVETVKISLKFIYFLNSWTIIDEQFKPMSQLSSAMPILSLFIKKLFQTLYFTFPTVYGRQKIQLP